MPTNYPLQGHGFNLRPARIVGASIDEPKFVRILLPPTQGRFTLGTYAGDVTAWAHSNITTWEQWNSTALIEGYFKLVDNTGLGLQRNLFNTSCIEVYDCQGNHVGVIHETAFVLHCRHNLHIALTHIAGMLGRVHGQLHTASAVGAMYTRVARNLHLTPYRSASQQAAGRALRNGATRQGLEDRGLELPDYIDDEVTAWFDSLDISFGNELEVYGLSPSRALQVLNSLPDLELSSSTSYRHTVTSEWKAVPDGSVSGGCEVVSPPLRNGVQDFMQLRRVMLALKNAGGRITSACGGHVHFGVEELSPHDRARTVEAHHAYQPLFDAFVSARRRGTRTYLGPRMQSTAAMLAEQFRDRAGAMAQDVNDNQVPRGEVAAHHDRYKNWNVCSYVKYGTFENRQLEGCLNPKKMFAWLCLNRAFIKACVINQGDYVPQESTLMFLLNNGNSPQQLLSNIAVQTNMPLSVQNLIGSFIR